MSNHNKLLQLHLPEALTSTTDNNACDFTTRERAKKKKSPRIIFFSVCFWRSMRKHANCTFLIIIYSTDYYLSDRKGKKENYFTDK